MSRRKCTIGQCGDTCTVSHLGQFDYSPYQEEKQWWRCSKTCFLVILKTGETIVCQVELQADKYIKVAFEFDVEDGNHSEE